MPKIVSREQKNTKGPHDKIHRFQRLQTGLGGNSKTWEPRATSKTRCWKLMGEKLMGCCMKNVWKRWYHLKKTSKIHQNSKNLSKPGSFLEVDKGFQSFQNDEFPIPFNVHFIPSKSTVENFPTAQQLHNIHKKKIHQKNMLLRATRLRCTGWGRPNSCTSSSWGHCLSPGWGVPVIQSSRSFWGSLRCHERILIQSPGWKTWEKSMEDKFGMIGWCSRIFFVWWCLM